MRIKHVSFVQCDHFVSVAHIPHCVLLPQVVTTVTIKDYKTARLPGGDSAEATTTESRFQVIFILPYNSLKLIPAIFFPAITTSIVRQKLAFWIYSKLMTVGILIVYFN